MMNDRKLRKIILKSLPIETERLILRYIEPGDVYDMYEYASRNDVCEFLLWRPHVNLATTEGYIEFLQKRYKKGLYADWALELKESGKMIGTCGYAHINSESAECEIGYVLSPEYQGNGYMTEAVNAILELTFDVLELESARLRIISENESSIRLAKRMGFKHTESIQMDIKEEKRDVDIYSITKNEYKK